MKIDNDCYWCKGHHPSYKCPNKTNMKDNENDFNNVIDMAYEWLQKHSDMYRGDNASECMIAAYKAGAMEMLIQFRFKLSSDCNCPDDNKKD